MMLPPPSPPPSPSPPEADNTTIILNFFGMARVLFNSHGTWMQHPSEVESDLPPAPPTPAKRSHKKKPPLPPTPPTMPATPTNPTETQVLNALEQSAK